MGAIVEFKAIVDISTKEYSQHRAAPKQSLRQYRGAMVARTNPVNAENIGWHMRIASSTRGDANKPLARNAITMIRCFTRVTSLQLLEFNVGYVFFDWTDQKSNFLAYFRIRRVDKFIGIPIIQWFSIPGNVELNMKLADVLRRYVLDDQSISAVSRETGVSQPTLQEFAVGKSDGNFADLRLSSAQRLIDHYGIGKSLTNNSRRKNGGKRMKLKDELQAGECQDSPEKFRERLIDNLMDMFPETTIDDLVCLPTDALAYCNHIRKGVGSEYLSDVVILKALINIRKQRNCPIGLKSRGRRRIIKRELLNAGCDMDQIFFKDLVVDCMTGMFRDLTIDELICQPREARALCNYVRTKAECTGLGDDFILSTLLNVRKAANRN